MPETIRAGLRSRARIGAALLLALLVAACSHLPAEKVALPTPHRALPGLAPRERVDEALQRLRQGDTAQARAELEAALVVEPHNARARRLMTQIDTDPKVLLGDRHYAYTVRQGETLWSLSQRLLGDPLLFYALARYNGMEVPEDLAGGRVLQIPGVPKRAAPPPRRPTVARAASTPAPAPAPTPAPAPVPPPPPVQARAADPAQANQLRRTALEHMNRGQIDQAEALLQQARALDPGNPVIQAELDRARRIQASVRPRS